MRHNIHYLKLIGKIFFLQFYAQKPVLMGNKILMHFLYAQINYLDLYDFQLLSGKLLDSRLRGCGFKS